MLTQEVAQKYARAIFASSKDKNLLDKVFDDLTDLNKYVISEKSLMNFLNSPNVFIENKIRLIKEVFSNRMDRLVVEFLVVLVDKKRIGFLSDIIDEYVRLVEADKGIGRVTAITAIPMNDNEKTELKSKLHTKTNLKIKLEEKVDKSIIGGMIVVMYNEIIDGSIRYQLEQVSEQLGSVRVH